MLRLTAKVYDFLLVLYNDYDYVKINETVVVNEKINFASILKPNFLYGRG